jgi:hypothetical protein
MVLDTSKNFTDVVVPFALNCTQEFLALGSIATVEGPCVMKNQLAEIEDPDYAKKANAMFFCESCDAHIHGEVMYNRHMNGRRHRNKLKKKQERADNA